jgi:hypothetical protein
LILLNKAKCRVCGDEIISTHRHDYKECSCGSIMVDGGKDYLRRGGSQENFEDMSIIVDEAPRLGLQLLSGGQEIKMHTKFVCVGDKCPVHKPSDHPLVNQPLFWGQFFYRYCYHEDGNNQWHNDPDSLEYQGCVNPDCDGCCNGN